MFIIVPDIFMHSIGNKIPLLVLWLERQFPCYAMMHKKWKRKLIVRFHLSNNEQISTIEEKKNTYKESK